MKEKSVKLRIFTIVVAVVILLGISISIITNMGVFKNFTSIAKESKDINKSTEISEITEVATVYSVSVGDGKTVPVPKGFYYVGGSINSGVIISDNEADKYDGKTDKTTHEYATKLKGNQFVWIPCTIEEYTKIDF